MRKVSLITSLFAISSITPLAQAATGTINFTGELTAATCQITTNGGGPITIPLGKISIDDVKETGATSPIASGTTFFDIDCKGTAGLQTVAMKFDPAAGSGFNPDNVDLLGLTPVQGVATGVGIGMLDENNTLIKLGSGETLDTALVPGQAAGDTTAKIGLRAAYFRSTANKPTVGSANATMPFTLSYK